MRWSDWRRWAACCFASAACLAGSFAYGQDLGGPPPVPTRLPAVQASAANVAALESRLTELENRLNAEQPKSAESGVEVGSDLKMEAKWNHGLELQSKNKDFRIHVGGRTQVDTTAFSGSGNIENSIDDGGVGPLRSATNFRRGRLRVDGTMYEVVEFACEYDFINEVDVNPAPSPLPPQTNPDAIPAPTDLWIQIKQLPILGTVRVGNQKDPIGFEHLTSSRWLNFMERSFMQDAFTGPFNNGFIPGIQAFDTMFDERGTWAIGEFKNTNNIFANGVGDGELETAGRLTLLPVYQDEGRYLIHTGVSGMFRDLDENQVRFRTRGDLRSGSPSSYNPVFANTGNFAGDSQYFLGLELVSIWGPWMVQAEYQGDWISDAVTVTQAVPGAVGLQPVAGTAVGPYFAHGAYVELLYFLTGESRPYNRKTGVVDRVIPYENFWFVKTPGGTCAGWGAWQVAGRYSHLDLSDAGIDGGVLDSFTLGLNWFWNPNVKVQANYDITWRDFTNNLNANGDGQVHGFGMRMAFDF